MNAFYLVGKIIDEPEKLETANGVRICKLRLAVEKNSKEATETYEIFEVILFRALAQEEYQNGQMIAVSGKLQANNYEKDSSFYYNAKLIGSNVSYIS